MRSRSQQVALLSILFFQQFAQCAAVEKSLLPSFFVQLPGEKSFRYRGDGFAATCTGTGIHYQFDGEAAHALDIRFLRAQAVEPDGHGRLEGAVNVLRGREPEKWVRDLSIFSGVSYSNAWPGISVVYSVATGRLKTEFQLEPGADTRAIQWRVDGSDSVRMLADGSLSMVSGGQELKEAPPVVFEEDRLTGTRRVISGSFRMVDTKSVGILVGPHDNRNRVIFDPVISYSTYLGASQQTLITGIALDSKGNSVVVGYTIPLDIGPGITVGTPTGVSAFVAKLSADGKQLISCTYIGGSLDNRALGVAVDRWDNIYLVGKTTSQDFPLFKPIQDTLSGTQDAFIAELNSAGTSFMFCTYFGGSDVDDATGVAVDRQGFIYVGGDTQSTNFPTRNAFQPNFGGAQDAFLVKLGISGSQVIWSSYLGGAGVEQAAAIAVNPFGGVVIVGSTSSSNYPVASALQPQNAGAQDAFITEINSSGRSLLFSTYLGGSGGTAGLPEAASGVAVDGEGSVYVAGTTSSPNFPSTPNAFQTAPPRGLLDAFAAKFSKSGSLMYSTLIGGSASDYATAIAVDTAGNAHVAGYTASADFPVQNTLQGFGGVYDAFVAKLNPSGTGLIYGTLIGGSLNDSAAAIAVDRYGTVVVAGQTLSSDFPVVNAYQQQRQNGNVSGFVCRIQEGWTPVLFSSDGVWSTDYLTNGGSNGVSNAVFTDNYFGHPGDIPILGDWRGTGHQSVGLFRNGTWFLDTDGDGLYTASDRTFVFGQAGDIPVVGDWNGTGTIKAGLYRNGSFILDLSGHLTGVPTGTPDAVFSFGLSTDLPVVGDWNHLGTAKVGVFRDGQWLLDTTGTHTINGPIRHFGFKGDLPLVGDWDGSGFPKAGVYSNGTFILDYDGDWALDPAKDVGLSFGTPSPYALIRH